jgi:hypothetical protein
VGQHELVVAHKRLGVLEVLLVNLEGYLFALPHAKSY